MAVTCLKSADDVLSFDPCSILTVRVGAEKKDFFIHKDLICKHSPFFKTATNGQWEEGKTNLVEMPEDDPEAFKIYCGWLYSHPLFETRDQCLTFNEKQLNNTGVPEYERLTAAYLLGDKILDHDFCDMIFDRLINHVEALNVWPTDHFRTILSLSPEGSPARQIFLDVWVYVGGVAWVLDKSKHSYDKQTWRDILGAVMAHQGKSREVQDRPWRTDICRYHHHTKNGGECYKKRKGWDGIGAL